MKHSLKVLVVDDEPYILKATTRILRSAGYEVFNAETGEKAVEMCREQQPDIVLLDVVLPDISGIEVCQRMKQDSALRDIYVALMSGIQNSSDEQAGGIEAGADDFITKSMSKREFLARIQAIARLKHSEKALQRARDELELRVQERTRELQHAKDEAEKASRAKSRFLAKISHEFLTPLHSMLGYAELLAGADNLTAQQARNLQTIKTSAENLLILINNLLDFVALDAGQMEKQPEEFHFPQFLRRLAQQIGFLAQKKGVSFEYVEDPDLPGIIQFDQQRLRQILTHLLENAMKFTPEGTILLTVTRSVATDTLQPGINHDDATIRFEIQDTGVGIAQERLASLYTPFEDTEKNVSYSSGAGIGLALTSGLLALFGSELYVESVRNQGSRFWFDLEVPVMEERRGVDKPACEPTVISSSEIAPFIPLAEEHRQQLLRQAERGDVKAILTYLKTLEAIGKEFQPFIATVRTLAEEFEVDRIVELLTVEEKRQ